MFGGFLLQLVLSDRLLWLTIPPPDWALVRLISKQLHMRGINILKVWQIRYSSNLLWDIQFDLVSLLWDAIHVMQHLQVVLWGISDLVFVKEVIDVPHKLWLWCALSPYFLLNIDLFDWSLHLRSLTLDQCTLSRCLLLCYVLLCFLLLGLFLGHAPALCKSHLDY